VHRVSLNEIFIPPAAPSLHLFTNYGLYYAIAVGRSPLNLQMSFDSESLRCVLTQAKMHER